MTKYFSSNIHLQVFGATVLNRPEAQYEGPMRHKFNQDYPMYIVNIREIKGTFFKFLFFSILI